ncbi:MAG: glycosyltransferase [Methanosphaera sp.]|nr:glycosyltransferase [Methanosphaera sp.]
MVKVSVIMPVYNGAKYLENSIGSLYNQTLSDIELICVNDGSTDNSLEILEQLKDKYQSIKIISQENKGSGSARDTGIENATGEYIAFLDADDIYMDKDALEVMYEYGHTNNAIMVSSNLERIRPDGRGIGNFNYKENNYTYFSKQETISPSEYGIPWAFYKNIFKRSFIVDNKILFPDLLRGQDPVFLSEILIRIDKIYTVDRTLYGYNYTTNGGSNSKVDTYQKKYDFMKHYHNTIKLLEENQLYDQSEAYKDQLLKYISIKHNFDDKQLISIIHEIFMDECDYEFETLENELAYLRLELINTDIPVLLKYNLEVVKNDLFETSITTNRFIDNRVLTKYTQLCQLLTSDDIIDSNLTIKPKNMNLTQLKTSMENSTSWRTTAPLSKLNNATIKVLKNIKHWLVKIW